MAQIGELIVSLARYERVHSGPRLHRAGMLPNKSYQIRRRADLLALSLIHAGSGWCNGEAVRAPCIVVHGAGEPQSLRPDTAWDECYVVFSGSANAVLAAAGVGHLPKIAAIDQAVADALVRQFREFIALVPLRGGADLLDMAALGWLTLAAASVREEWPHRLDQVEAWLRAHLEQDFEFDRLADHCGVSLATLRRFWVAKYGQSPAAWLLRLRIERACLLLEQTSHRIADVARRCGWHDQRRFATYFKQRMGATPTEWRQRGTRESIS